MLHAPSVASRRLLDCIACALGVAFATMGERTVAAGVAVVVDGRPLHLKPGPIERVGRVFVPLRGIFERLGASVVYQNRQINSTKGSTSVSLAIGSRQATVNGQPQTIDVAPFIVGATTYVPLRFVAQSLGAGVSYDGAARLVEITVPRQPPSIPATPPNPPPVSIVQLRARQPAPDALTGNRFARIAAQFSHAVDVDSVRVWLDGNDVTSRSGVSAGGFSYEPPAPLDFGTHTVRVAGLDRGGLRFTHSWSFTTTRPAPPPQSPVQLRNQEPSPNATVENRRAVVSANFVPQADAASVRVRLDGSDITVFSGVSPGGFSYKPLAPLEFGTHTLRVSGRGRAGLPFDHSWSFTTARTPTPRPSPTPPPENPVQLRDQRPSPGATVHDRFAVVAANFAPQADGPSVRIRLDGNDITVRSAVSSGGFSYKPPAPLEFGTHTVRVVGRGQAGLAFDHSWSFTTARTPTPPPSPTPPPENPVQLRDQQPSAGAIVHDRFAVVAANFGPQADGPSVRVRLDGTDITERSGVWSGGFSYKPPAPLEFGSHKVRVSGRGRSGLPFDHSWSFTVRRTGPIVTPTLPPTPQPTAAPTRVPRVIPTAAPTPQPTPTPTRALKVVPTATPTATPTGRNRRSEGRLTRAQSKRCLKARRDRRGSAAVERARGFRT